MPRIISKHWLQLFCIFLVSFGISLAGASLVRALIFPPQSPNPEVVTSDPESPFQEKSSYISLQPIVDEWLTTLPEDTRVGLMIYDLDNQQSAASYQSTEIFNNASLYKLLFVYDGYEQLDSGLEDGETYFGTFYDTDPDNPYQTIATDYTIQACLDAAIRTSHNDCGEALYNDPARQTRVGSMIEKLNLSNTTEFGLSSTPADMTKLLEFISEHQTLSSTSWNKLQDSMLNQPITADGDNLRQGLPDGFNVAKVYAKVGWERGYDYWNVYNEAAIIEFSETNRHYLVTIMSENLPDSELLLQLGQSLETAILTPKTP